MAAKIIMISCKSAAGYINLIIKAAAYSAPAASKKILPIMHIAEN